MFFARTTPTAKFELKKLDQFGIHPYFNEEFARISFNLDCDLTDVFDWNTYNIFAFVTVEHTSEFSNHSQITIWDEIVMRADLDTHHLQKNKRAEYFISDKYNTMRGKTVKVFFNYAHMPVMGFNQMFKFEIGEIQMPDLYLGNYLRKDQN